MVFGFSDRETKRRDMILQREFSNTTLSPELASKIIASLRNMPVASIVEPYGAKFTDEEKEKLYDNIINSSYKPLQVEIIRAWFLFRVQDMLERGNCPSFVEVIFISEVCGNELAGTIFKKMLEFVKIYDKETREYINSPKSEIEQIIFKKIIGEKKPIIRSASELDLLEMD